MLTSSLQSSSSLPATSRRGTPALLAVFALLPMSLAACGKDKDDDTGLSDDTASATDDTAHDTDQDSVPTVDAVSPDDGSTDVLRNVTISATFSEAMDAASLDTAFTLSTGDPATDVAGTVIYADGTAVFWPAAHLEADTEYLATVSTDAKSELSIPMDSPETWSFTTGAEFAPGKPVDLGTAGNFVILAKSGISTVPTSAVTGDIAVSPAAASYITGFSLTADSTNTFATSPQVTGKIYAADYADPTPSQLTTAVSDMELAFTDAAGRAPDVTELGEGNVGGMTLESGVYKWGTGLLIPTDLTLDGDATQVWIFQIAQDLTVSSGVNVTLTGGAVPENVFWQVAGFVELGTTAHLEGIVITQTAIEVRTGASVNGRLLAQTAVELDSSVVVEPAN